MNMGYIALYRQIVENEFWFYERFTKAQAWIDLLLLANHKSNSFDVRGNEVKLERGQLGYSIKSLSQRWKWNERTVDKFLSVLKNRQMIQCRKSHITTVITIINYNRYQGSTEQNTEQMQNRIHTNNNDKNEKEYTEEFLRFWDVYGKKIDRVKCFKLWTKLTTTDKEKIFTTLPSYISATPDIQYRKNPLTYLNGKCWNDEITTQQKNVKPTWDYEKLSITN